MRGRGHFESLESRKLLAGVTLITHGFEFSAGLPNWLATMETALSNRMGGANIYRLVITGGSSPVVNSFTRITANGSTTGEAIIDLDWSACANSVFYPSVTTATIANLVKPYLTTARNLPGDPLTAHPLGEMPIHIAGHSRGGSLVADLARKLASDGLWVDNLTLWDPVPVGSDPAVSIGDNVVFADEVFQNNASPSGTATAGAHNINLTGVSGVGHSETHAYYLGTINRAATNDGDGITINNNWYSGAGAGPRSSVMYDWSRIGSGTRPADGISNLDGGAAARTHIAVAPTTQWSNIGSVNLTGDASGFIANGNSLNISYRYQDSTGGGVSSFYLDNDTNPYDGFARTYGTSAALLPTGATPNVSGLQSFPINWTSAGLGDGTYRLAAKIVNAAGVTRYAYMPRPVYVTAGGAELVNKRWTNDLSNSSWTDSSNFTPGGVPVTGDHVLVPSGATTIAADATGQSLIVGGGSVALGASQHFSSLTIADNAGVTMSANGNRFLQSGGLNIATNGKLDLNDDDLIVSYSGASPFTQVRQWVINGFSSVPDASKRGIVSTSGQNAGGATILALLDNALVGTGQWPPGSGNTVPLNSVVAKYTYFGDVNLDGQVTGDDYGVIDANLNTTPAAGVAWIDGDANLDGIVSGDDYGTIDANLGRGVGQPLAVLDSTTRDRELLDLLG